MSTITFTSIPSETQLHRNFVIQWYQDKEKVNWDR